MNSTTTTGPLRVVAEADAAPGRFDDLLALLPALALATRAEAGNVSYVVTRDTETRDRVVFIEEWVSREVFDAHLASPHLAQYAAASEPLLARPVRIVVAEPLDV